MHAARFAPAIVNAAVTAAVAENKGPLVPEPSYTLAI
jgi:hypothetical protein